jgi:multidrug efflux pump subunit AcrA (membrane-fusion protein)
LKNAAATPGVVAGNDVEVAQQTAEADRARLRAADQNVAAAKSALSAIAEIESYLQVRAPFDGVVTERDVHPGALVAPVLENCVSRRVKGPKLTFTVPAFSGEKFSGTIARIPDSLDVKTRSRLNST